MMKATPRTLKKLEEWIAAYAACTPEELTEKINASTPFSVGVEIGVLSAISGACGILDKKSGRRYRRQLNRNVEKLLKIIGKFYGLKLKKRTYQP